MTTAPRGLRWGSKTDRRQVPFFAHEVVEYALGGALIATGIHLSGGLEKEMLFIGSSLVAWNLVTRGPLGVLKAIGRRLHHAGDFLIIAYAAAAPFFGFVRHDIRAVLLTEAIALILVLVERETRYVTARPERTTVIDARARPEPKP